MKGIILLILIAVSLQSFGQDTAAIRKQQEEANKFVQNLVTKTSLSDFQKWMYENVSAKQMNEASFQQLYNLFVQQKYYQSIQAKEQPKKLK